MTTIGAALDAFLAEQEERLSERTFRRYDEVIGLLRDCMNSYGHTMLSDVDRKRLGNAYDAGDDEAFCHLFGPDQIPTQIGQFLGWFVIRKTMAGQEFLRACGTVTKKLGKWLEANGHVDEAAAADIRERGAEAGEELPKAEKLGDFLFDETRKVPQFDPDSIPDADWVEDQLWIERVEPGELWFEGGVGPVKVPRAATDLARPGWAVTIVLARLDGNWRVVEVGNVYP